MLLTALCSVVLIQILAYVTLQYTGNKNNVWIILVAFIILNTFVLPNMKMFEYKLDPNQMRCGLIMIPIVFTFWILSNILSIITYFIFRRIYRKTTTNHG